MITIRKLTMRERDGKPSWYISGNQGYLHHGQWNKDMHNPLDYSEYGYFETADAAVDHLNEHVDPGTPFQIIDGIDTYHEVTERNVNHLTSAFVVAQMFMFALIVGLALLGLLLILLEC